MRKFKILLFLAALFLIISLNINAQVRVNININSQPQWGPDEYDYVEYYYLPEIGIYYYAPEAKFIFRKGNRWVYAYNLPYQYSHVNLYNTYKVVINEPKPYLRNSYYASHYKKYKNYHSRQVSLRDSKNPRFNNQGNFRGKMDNKSQNNTVKSRSGAINNKSSHGTMNKNKSGNGNQKGKGQKNNRK